MSARRYRPRHRRPSKAKPALAVGSVSTAFMLSSANSSAAAATGDDLARLGLKTSVQTQTETPAPVAPPIDSADRPVTNPAPATPNTPQPAVLAETTTRPPATARGGLLPIGTVLTAPAAPRQPFRIHVHGLPREDVRVWQAQMARRGWDLRVDGYFGPESHGVARAFIAEKGLVKPPGTTLTKVLWTATWEVSVS